MLIGTREIKTILDEYNIHPKGALHVGAHECEELQFYNSIGISSSNVYWVEAMSDKVEEAQKKNIPNVYQAVVSDEDDVDVVFNISNNGQSSSILEFGTHTTHHPHVWYVNKVNCKTVTLDTFIAQQDIPKQTLEFWNFDIQGAELKALKGATTAINYAKAIYLEVNDEQVYQDCALISEIDEYLADHSFKRVLTNMTEFHWGDALYVKLPNYHLCSM